MENIFLFKRPFRYLDVKTGTLCLIITGNWGKGLNRILSQTQVIGKSLRPVYTYAIEQLNIERLSNSELKKKKALPS